MAIERETLETASLYVTAGGLGSTLVNLHLSLDALSQEHYGRAAGHVVASVVSAVGSGVALMSVPRSYHVPINPAAETSQTEATSDPNFTE